MINQFESANYPDKEPKTLINGTRWTWTRSDITETYPTASYTLKYCVSHPDEDRDYTITADKVDNAHVVEVSSATSNFKPGDVMWKAVIVRDSDSEEVIVDEGFFEVRAQKGTIASHTYKVLSAIRAVLENKATKDQSSYSINGRSINRYSFEELTKLEKQYLARWHKEKNQIDVKNGRKVKNRTLVRLNA